MVQRRVSFLTTLLSLTAAQQQQATSIFTTAATAGATVFSSLKTARQSLETAVKNNDSATIDQVSATIGNSTAQRTANDAKADAAFYQILTADQQSKLTQFEAQGGGFGPGHGPGPRRHP
jgi:Spy/CpxP family protein refolding chaperone